MPRHGALPRHRPRRDSPRWRAASTAALLYRAARAYSRGGPLRFAWYAALLFWRRRNRRLRR
ncbi:hypothetical protein [Streptomyces hainanensis]|uniref:Uncharacterized protein n=1 Tax=Streptomyces hainanensis TaxID=402648 RepID=A0A4R4SLV0_9ACTN|nr:hypothetical protein [Streptomyces hainanensis]TDC62553.1 hypothetical protein E1283_33910 [Streptomyces hainanensis]